MANPPELIEKIGSHLREHLTPYRCEHVLSVRDQAVSLARQHGINEDQAELAALLHDCLRNFPTTNCSSTPTSTNWKSMSTSENPAASRQSRTVFCPE